MEITLTALAPEMVATLLARSGGRITVEMVKADIAAGAPTNADGTMNLIHYAAWLAREMNNRG